MGKLEKFKSPADEYKLDVRWWLAEGLHTDATLKNELDLLKEAGFGAIEFLAMDDPGADSSKYGWGSEEWVHDSGLLFEETTKRGLGVSATCGTNWSNCNLTTITPDDKAAAKELDFVTEHLKAGETRQGRIPECVLIMDGVTKQEFVAAVAIKDLGMKDGRHYLDKDSAIVLNTTVHNQELTFTAPDDSDYMLFYFWIHGTGQTAKPSVSVSYTVNYMDHYGIDAFIQYWDAEVINPALRETLKENGRAMMYMDSLELCTFGKGGQLWGYTFLDEFEKRRGYDLTPYLPFVVKEPGMMQPVFHYYYFMEDTVFEEKFYNDLYQTMSDMYMENMMKPMQEWCHKNHMMLRSEISYGLPFEISLPGKYVDDVETESLEFASQIEAYRGLAGCAHVYDRLFSSETGATTLNYMMPLDFYNQIVFTQFAAGVTKTVLHGYASIVGSEASTYWPGFEGMWPIFSERFGVRQPAYRHYNDWTAMMSRYQMVLRAGKPRMDLAILRLDYNFNNMYISPDEEDLYAHQIMRGHEGVYWKDMSLQDAGYTWDYFAPQILEEDFVDTADGLLLPDGPGYQAVIIYQNVMPVEAARKLLSMAQKGLPIVFVDGCTETIRPGNVNKFHEHAACMTPFNDGKDGELAEIIYTIKALPNVRTVSEQSKTIDALQELGVQPRTAFAEPNEKVLTLSRKFDDVRILYVYNMMYDDKESCTFTVVTEGQGKPYRLDCINGEIEELGCYTFTEQGTQLTITLAPGEARLYAIDTKASEVHAIQTNVCSLNKEGNTFVAKVFADGTYSILLSDGTEKNMEVNVPQKAELKLWNLEVEDWNEGKKVEVFEDRGLGLLTKEIYYETEKTMIAAGKVELKPWKDIVQIGPEVSGVGYYTITFTVPEDPENTLGAVLKMESTNGATLAVYVNGEKAPMADIHALTTDISGLIHTGENTLLVEVSTSLNNRLLARGYYDRAGELSKLVAKEANNATSVGGNDGEEMQESGPSFDVSTFVRDYGLVGEASVNFYRKVVFE